MIVVAKLRQCAFGVVTIVSNLFAEAVFFTEFFPHNLNNVVCVAVGFGKDQCFGHFEFAFFIESFGKHLRQMLFEGADDGPNLIGVDDFVVELCLGINNGFIQLPPAFFAGELFAVIQILAFPDGAATKGLWDSWRERISPDC